MTGGFDDHTTAKAGEKMHTSDKSGIIDSMSDDVSESKNPEADVVGRAGAGAGAVAGEARRDGGPSTARRHRTAGGSCSAWTTCP